MVPASVAVEPANGGTGSCGVTVSADPHVAHHPDIAAVTARYLACVRSARSPADRADLQIDNVASALLALSRPEEVRVKHANGRTSLCSRRVVPLKSHVKRSQRNKRAAISRDRDVAQRTAVVEPSSVLSPTQQVGLLAAVGLSDAKFGRIRRAFGGAKCGMASAHALRAARSLLACHPASAVSVGETGAHLSNLRLAVERRVADLWAAGLFAERYLYDEHGRPIPRTRDYPDPSGSEPR